MATLRAILLWAHGTHGTHTHTRCARCPNCARLFDTRLGVQVHGTLTCARCCQPF